MGRFVGRADQMAAKGACWRHAGIHDVPAAYDLTGFGWYLKKAHALRTGAQGRAGGLPGNII